MKRAAADDAQEERASQAIAPRAGGDTGAPPVGTTGAHRAGDVIDLDVRGTRMRVLRSTLTAGPPGSLLARLFAAETGPWSARPQADGTHFIDDDPRDFEAVLCYLRYGADGVRFDDAPRAWRARAISAYYMLDAMADACLLEALRAELRVVPPCAVGSALYAYEGNIDEVDSNVGVGIVPVHVSFVRDWNLGHLCALIAREVGLPVDQLAFYCGDWIVRGGLAEFKRYAGRIDATAAAEFDTLLGGHRLARVDGGGLLVTRRRPAGQTAIFCKAYRIGADGAIARAAPTVAVATVATSDKADGSLDRDAVVYAACEALSVDPTLVVATYVEWMDSLDRGFELDPYMEIYSWDKVWIVSAGSPDAAAACAADMPGLCEDAKRLVRAANRSLLPCP